MLVNLVCQLDWDIGYPETWSTLLGMFMSIFNIYKLSKAYCPVLCGRSFFIPWRGLALLQLRVNSPLWQPLDWNTAFQCPMKFKLRHDFYRFWAFQPQYCVSKLLKTNVFIHTEIIYVHIILFTTTKCLGTAQRSMSFRVDARDIFTWCRNA